ncbi:MAG TPA: glycosyltransferase family 2 protein [Xanthobacteraceae bacterium]|nr:glycosyltransferase family 2 protein [Xanthobacteraceae bacterium]
MTAGADAIFVHTSGHSARDDLQSADNHDDTLRIKVVIVTYKCAQLTIECLRSVETERGAASLSIQAIVVDNASGDALQISQAVRDNDWSSWVTLINAPINGGFAYGNNLGIAHAYLGGAPAYIYLLNPDTQVRSGAIAALVRFMETHPNVGISGSGFENPDGSEWPIAFRFPTLVSEIIAGMEFGPLTRILQRWVVAREMPSVPQQTDWICGASMMIRPAVFAAIGGFDENYFLYFEETDLCYRARQSGFPTWYVPESRVMHIMGQSTQVTNLAGGTRRLPSYWFESRRRYFAMTFGLTHAIAIDIAALVAHSLGWLKRLLIGRRRHAVPYYIRDLLRHSTIFAKNRDLRAVRCFQPRR